MTAQWCGLAQRKLVQAFYYNGTLAVFATGEVPTPGHEVVIERSMTTVEPPQFPLLQCRRPGICNDVVTPYTVSQLFAIGAYRDAILVTHAGGRDAVRVEPIRESAATDPSGSLIGDVPVPYVLPPSAGRSTTERGEATGYSRRFEFAEALREAIGAFAPVEETYRDQLHSFTVVEVGVEIGGIAGFRHLFVRVRHVPNARAGKGA